MAVLPDEAVKRTLNDTKFDGKVILVAVGNALWQSPAGASGDRRLFLSLGNPWDSEYRKKKSLNSSLSI